jgi:hypothetical protein
MDGPLEHRPESHYTDAEKETALLAYVLCSGNRIRAAELCAEQGLNVPNQTIYRWATHSEIPRLERIRAEIAPKLKAQMAEMHQGLAVSAAEIEAKAIGQLDERLDGETVSAKDLSAVMQRAAIAGGIHGEKHLLYSGQPTAIVRRDFDQIKRELKDKGIVLDGTAVEIGPETEAA